MICCSWKFWCCKSLFRSLQAADGTAASSTAAAPSRSAEQQQGSVSAAAGGAGSDLDEQQGTGPGPSARVESHPVAVDDPLDDGWPADEVGSHNSHGIHVSTAAGNLVISASCSFAQVKGAHCVCTFDVRAPLTARAGLANDFTSMARHEFLWCAGVGALAHPPQSDAWSAACAVEGQSSAVLGAGPDCRCEPRIPSFCAASEPFPSEGPAGSSTSNISPSAQQAPPLPLPRSPYPSPAHPPHCRERMSVSRVLVAKRAAVAALPQQTMTNLHASHIETSARSLVHSMLQASRPPR